VRVLSVALVWLALAQPCWGQAGQTPDTFSEAGARLGEALIREIENMDLRTLRTRLVVGTPAEAQRELRELVVLGARRFVDAAIRQVAARSSGDTPDTDPARWQREVNQLTDTLVDYDAVVGDLIARGIREDVARSRDPSELKAVLARVMGAGIQAGSDALQREYRRIQAEARVAADAGTLAALRSTVAIHYGRNDGRFPASKEEVRRLYQAGTGRPLEFACRGNDFTYDASTGTVEVAISEPQHCSP
jgi:hypothetical protein